jgi:uncharacterized protein YyaL (SSP411 family)
VSGGFFDTAADGAEKALGVLGTRRKPFQDSPTPAGNSVAAIALLRLHALTNQPSYRENAEQTLELLAGLADKFGIFAATYGIAAVHLSHPHTQIVVIGEDDLAEQFCTIAAGFFAFHKTVLKLAGNEVVPQNLPPALAATIPHLPGLKQGKLKQGKIEPGKSVAVICSGFSCQPPVTDPEQFRRSLGSALHSG